MRRRWTFIGCTTATIALLQLGTGSASAAEASDSCYITSYVTGPIPTFGEALAAWNWASATALSSVHLEATDTKADGMHPAIRLVTKNRSGGTHYWAWHHNTKGAHTTGTVNTSATDSKGIAQAWIEGGLFNKSTRTGSCSTSHLTNKS